MCFTKQKVRYKESKLDKSTIFSRKNNCDLTDNTRVYFYILKLFVPPYYVNYMLKLCSVQYSTVQKLAIRDSAIVLNLAIVHLSEIFHAPEVGTRNKEMTRNKELFSAEQLLPYWEFRLYTYILTHNRAATKLNDGDSVISAIGTLKKVKK